MSSKFTIWLENIKEKSQEEEKLIWHAMQRTEKRVKIKTKENKNKENRKKIEKHGRKIKADGLNGEGLF